MGQAKKRGTFEERLKQAIERKPVEDAVIAKLQSVHPVLRNESPRRIKGRLGFRVVAALAASLAIRRPRE